MDGWAFIRNLRSRFGTLFVGRYDKAIGLAMMAVLVIFSTADMVADWCNYAQLTDDSATFALVTGRPPPAALSALLAFTLIGTMFCLLECINAASLMWNGGHTRLPIELEQCAVLLLEEIPLASCNVSIATCRSGALTRSQTTAGILALLSTAIRLYVYVYAKRRCFKFEETSALKATVKLAVYVSVTAVWIMLLVINAFQWHHARHSPVTDNVTPAMTAHRHNLNLFGGVAIFILRSTKTPKGGVHLTKALLRTYGATVENNCLVDNIEQLVANVALHSRYYSCPPVGGQWPWQPRECRSASKLHVVFRYARPLTPDEMEPFGEITFNVAMMTSETSEASSTTRCTPMNGHPDGWTLHYINATLIRGSPKSDIAMMAIEYDLMKPWERTCVTPTLRFDSALPVC